MGLKAVAPGTVNGNLTVGGQGLFPRGTANAPSLAWTLDADGTGTGIYSSGADCVDVSIGGTDVSRWNASGHFVWPTNNTYDIGASGVGGTTAPRNIYAGTNVFAGGYAVPKILSKSAIPFISLGSGSVSAPGAITGLTNMATIHPRAYCYFPANALATSIAAGWYYCTFSTVSSGTAFLDTYTSGAPTIPSSPTAVTDGKGAFTGDTGEEFGPTITLPANALGANGQLRFSLATQSTNTANAKTLRARLSGNGGTIFISDAVTSSAAAGMLGYIANAGTTASQFSSTYGVSNINPTTLTLGTVDTTAQTTVVLSLQKATATEHLLLLAHTIEILTDGT